MTQAIKLSFKMLGVEDLIRSMDEWKRAVRARVIRNAVRKTGPIASRAMKQRAPRETGLLKKSIGHRVYTHRNGMGAGMVAGPRKGFEATVVGRKRKRKPRRYTQMTKNERNLGLAFGRTQKRNPTKYGHLVEGGFRTKGGGQVEPSRFMQLAWVSVQSRLTAAMRTAMKAGIEREAAKAAAKARGRR